MNILLSIDVFAKKFVLSIGQATIIGDYRKLLFSSESQFSKSKENCKIFFILSALLNIEKERK